MLTDSPSSNEGQGVHVLAIAPSAGLNGGIEAYVDAVLGQLAGSGASIERLDLHRGLTSPRANFRGKFAFAFRTVRSARGLRQSPQAILLVFHPSFAVLGSLIRMVAGGKSVRAHLFFYGRDIWGTNPILRWYWQRSGLGMVTISSYSAGALSRVGPARVLPPGIVPEHYYSLRAIPRGESQQMSAELHILSVFRLADAEQKGAYRLIAAVDHLRSDHHEVNLTLAGAGSAGSRLLRQVEQRKDWLTVVEGPPTAALHELYAEADLFVLATALRAGRRASGEGFGIVLVEAALAGLAVVVPAMGGSADAFLDGITGLSPADDSIESLTNALRWCVNHSDRLQVLGANGRRWASQKFHPEAYCRTVKAVLLESYADVRPDPLMLVEGDTTDE